MNHPSSFYQHEHLNRNTKKTDTCVRSYVTVQKTSSDFDFDLFYFENSATAVLVHLPVK